MRKKGGCGPVCSRRWYSSGGETQQQKVNKYVKWFPTVVSINKKTNKGLRKRLVGGQEHRSKEGTEGTWWSWADRDDMRRAGNGKGQRPFPSIRAVRTRAAAGLSPWPFLALTHPPAVTPAPCHWLNDSLSTFPSFLCGRDGVGQSPGSLRVPESGWDWLRRNGEPSGFSGSSLGLILTLPQRKVSLCQEDSEDN